MKTTAKHIYDATIVLTKIINEQRALPLRGKYLVARLHAKLQPEFIVLDGRRDDLIKAYDFHSMVAPPVSREDPFQQGEKVESDQFQVPDDKMPEFNAAWGEILAEEIEVDAQPIPLSALSLGDSLDGSIHAHELLTLGDLIIE